MIIEGITNPHNGLYFLGGIVIASLKEIESNEIEIFELFEHVSLIHTCSFSLFSLAIDWLYLMDIIDINTNKKLIKCF